MDHHPERWGHQLNKKTMVNNLPIAHTQYIINNFKN